MGLIVKHISHTVDLNRPVKKTYIDTLLATEDNLAHRFDITLKRGGETVTLPDGTAVIAYFIRYSDNATVPINNGSISGNVASITLTNACYSKPGQFALIIKVSVDGIINTMFYGEGTIFASSTETVVDEENVIPSLSDLLAQIEAMEAATNAAKAAAQDMLIVRYNVDTAKADKKQSEIRAAVAEKRACIAIDSKGRVYNYVGEEDDQKNKLGLVPTFRKAPDYDGLGKITWDELQILSDGTMHLWGNSSVKAPNPKTLRFTGAVSATYDGSEQVTVEIPESGSGTGTGSGLPEGGEPHQMLVTDSEGNAQWQERTHYKETVTVLPETTVQYTKPTDTASNNAITAVDDFGKHFEIGKTYTIIWNGETHESVCQMDKYSDGFNVLGNHHLWVSTFDDTGEPYFIYTNGSSLMIAAESDCEVTFSITEKEPVVHKLPAEYLPFPLTDGTVDILPEKTFSDDEVTEDGIVFLEPLPGEIVIGETYAVTYNGTDYTCTAAALDMSGGEGTMIASALGNIGAAMGDETMMTEEPFVFAYIPPEYYETAGAYALMMPLDGATEVTFGIKGAGGVKIDNSALDMDWVAKYDDVGETIVAETIGRGINVECPGADTAFFVEGASFIAYVDNERYDLTVVSYEGELAAGNLGLAAAGAPGNNEPFYVTALATGGLLFSWGAAGDMDASHTVSAYQTGSSQRVANQKVPDAFFPDIRPFYVNVQDNAADKTYDEISGAYSAGRMVCCELVYGGNTYVLYYGGSYDAAAHFFGIKYEVSIGSDGTVTVT